MTAKRPVEEDRRALEAYLEYQAAAIDRLSPDMRCLSLDARQEREVDLQSSSIIVAVDFSELYRELNPTQPGLERRLLALLGPEAQDQLQGLHAAALDFLFNRLPAPILLLPPHWEEFEVHADAVQAHGKAHIIRHGTLEDIRAEIAAAHPEVEEIFAKLSANGLPSPREVESSLRENLSADQFQSLWDCIRRDFPAIFGLLDQDKDMWALKLRRLRGRLRHLEDLDPTLAAEIQRDGEDRPAGYKRWQAALEEKLADKDERSRERDARAMRMLELLNPLLHDRGQQVLFVSRSADIFRVMQDNPGAFGCLRQEYLSRPQSSPWHTIFRNWHSLLFLGGIWGEQAAFDPTSVQRFEDYQTYFKSLLAGQHNESNQDLQSMVRDLETQTTTAYSMFSATRSSRDMGEGMSSSSGEGEERDWLRMFVVAMLNPDAFVEERRRERDRIEAATDEVVKRTIGYSDKLPLRTGNVKSVTQSALEKLENTDFFLRDVSDNEARDVLRTLLRMMVGQGEKEHIVELRGRVEGLPSTLRSGQDYRILATWSVLHGDWDAAKALINRSRREATSEKENSPRRLQCDLMEADCMIQGSHGYGHAHRLLTRRLKQLTGDSSVPREIITTIVCATGLIAIHECERHGENVEQFSYSHLQPGKLLLLEAIESMLAEWREIGSIDEYSEPLKQCIANNLLYAVSRAARAGDMLRIAPDGGSATGADVGGRQPLLVADEILDIVKYLRSRNRPTPALLDTLGYYFLKRWNAESLDNRGNDDVAMSLGLANHYLTSALAASPSDRERRTIDKHIQDMRTLIDNQRLVE